MKFNKSLALALVGGLIAFSSVAATTEIHGVKVEDSATVGNSALQLNGAGTRYKAGIFKVYVAGLYVGQKTTVSEDVAGQPGAKRMSLTMLREVAGEELGKLMTRGMEDNMGRAQMSKLVPGLMRMSQIFAEQKKLMPGDNILIDWVPDAGTVVTVKGKVQGEPFKEPEFFKALMSVWLGPVPADGKLKEALLGSK